MTCTNVAKVQGNIQHKELSEARKSGQPNSSCSCTACNSLSHPIRKCEKFMERPISEHRALDKQRGLCFKCLDKTIWLKFAQARNVAKHTLVTIIHSCIFLISCQNDQGLYCSMQKIQVQHWLPLSCKIKLLLGRLSLG